MDGKVQIYNDHEQLRDSLCIDADSHSRIPNPTKQNDDHHFRPINLQLTTAYIYVTDDWTGGFEDQTTTTTTKLRFSI